MRPLIYLASLALVLPGVALAAFFTAVDRVVAAGTLGTLVRVLWRGFVRTMDLLVRLGPWGLLIPALAVGAALALVGLAWSERFRVVGLALIALAGVASLVTIVARGAAPRSLSELAFHVPGLVAVGLCVWQLLADPRVALLRASR